MRGRLIFAILATVAGLSAVDVFLARTETREVGRAARRDFEAGSRLLAQGRAAEAIGPLQKAHVQDRNDRVFTLELAEALMQAGRAEQAGVLLRSELERTPNDGRANLLEARLLALEGEYGDARPYYHRAIYGNWAEQPGRQRTAARLELAGLLVSHGSSEELLAELLPLEWEAGGDLKLRKRLASLYLAAKSPARAGNAYRALIRDDPQDSDNQEGWGRLSWRPAITGRHSRSFRRRELRMKRRWRASWRSWILRGATSAQRRNWREVSPF
jgi:Putative Zn-dependent protease, contains TPR repeats